MQGNLDNRLIFNVQHCSMHDGPGIRTVIFFKGCPLRCPWCSNPESQQLGHELAFKPILCLGKDICARCEQACTHGGVKHDAQGYKIFTKKNCKLCGACVKACPSRALTLFGEACSVDELFQKGARDRDFYATSGGGITLSGGEPLWHGQKPAALLRMAKENGLHTCLETCGFFDFENTNTRTALNHLDWLIFDIKHTDNAVHKDVIGCHVNVIIKNLKSIREHYPLLPVVVRTPVVGGFNDSEQAIESIAKLLANIGGIQHYELLAYHAFGAAKYEHLGRTYTMTEAARVSDEHMVTLREIASRYVRCASN